MRLEVVAVLTLLLAPLALSQAPAGGGWTQLGGDPEHSRLATLPPGPLDVLSHGRLLDEDLAFYTGPFAVAAPGGLAMLIGSTQTGATECYLARVADGTLSILGDTLSLADAIPVGCLGTARLVGSAPHAGLLFACFDGAQDEVELRAFDAVTFELRWSAGLPAAPTNLPGAPGGPGQSAWGCGGIVEEDRVVVSFASAAQTTLVAYDLDGRVLWTSTVTLGAVGPRLPISNDLTAPALGYQHVTRMKGGYALFRSVSPFSLAWFDENGRLIDAQIEGEEIFDAQRDPGTDVARPVGQGEYALAVIRDYALLVRAIDFSATYVALPSEVVQIARDPVWWRDHYVLPSVSDVVVMRTPDFRDPWTWKSSRATLLDTLVTPAGELVVLSRAQTDDSFLVSLARLDLDSRVETQRLELPALPMTAREAADGCVSIACDGKLIPVGDRGLLVLLRSGQAIVLGVADEALLPRVTASSLYPPEDAPFTITVEAPPGAVNVSVAWGDGTFDAVEDGTMSHTFTSAGTHVIHVTAHYPDGRTGTRALAVHVGAPEPQRLSAIQRAFSPDNQELTFFLIGLALTGGGALFAALLRHRRHSRLAEEERRIAELVDLAGRDAEAGLAALGRHRAHLRQAHTRREIDDAQLVLLEGRAIRAMKVARYRLLGAAINHLSPQFLRLLDAALEDGHITQGEVEGLVAALEREASLDTAQRQALVARLRSWVGAHA